MWCELPRNRSYTDIQVLGEKKILEGEKGNRMEPVVGSILEGKVTTITKFGAFVLLSGGKSGLVHISEIANTYVNDVHDYLTEGQAVKVLVLSTDNNRINLSIKKALPREEHSAQPRSVQHLGGTSPRPFNTSRPASVPRPPQRREFSRGQVLQPTGDMTFEDKLKQFMTASEGKMADLNRNIDGKRGGGRRRK
jgi:S1 RNA binding domain protein